MSDFTFIMLCTLVICGIFYVIATIVKEAVSFIKPTQIKKIIFLVIFMLVFCIVFVYSGTVRAESVEDQLKTIEKQVVENPQIRYIKFCSKNKISTFKAYKNKKVIDRIERKEIFGTIPKYGLNTFARYGTENEEFVLIFLEGSHMATDNSLYASPLFMNMNILYVQTINKEIGVNIADFWKENEREAFAESLAKVFDLRFPNATKFAIVAFSNGGTGADATFKVLTEKGLECTCVVLQDSYPKWKSIDNIETSNAKLLVMMSRENTKDTCTGNTKEYVLKYTDNAPFEQGLTKTNKENMYYIYLDLPHGGLESNKIAIFTTYSFICTADNVIY